MMKRLSSQARALLELLSSPTLPTIFGKEICRQLGGISYQDMQRFVGELRDNHIPIVSGPDGFRIERDPERFHEANQHYFARTNSMLARCDRLVQTERMIRDGRIERHIFEVVETGQHLHTDISTVRFAPNGQGDLGL